MAIDSPCLPWSSVLAAVLFAAGCGSEPAPSAPTASARPYSVDDDLRSKTKSVPLAFLEQTVGVTTLAEFRESHPEAESLTPEEGARFVEYRIDFTDEKPIRFADQPIPRVDFAFYDGKLFAITGWFQTKNFDEIDKGLVKEFGEGIAVAGNRMWKTDKGQSLQISGRSTAIGTFFMKDDALAEAMRADKAM